MEDTFKTRTPVSPARSNIAHAGTLGFKRQHILHHPLQHRNNDETGYLRARLVQREMDDANRRDLGDSLSQPNTQPMSRKGSLQVEMGSSTNMMCERGNSQAQQVEVSTAVRNLRAAGEQQILQLTHTYSSVSKKLNEIRIMGQQLKALGKAAEEVLREFDIGDMSTRREYTAQIKGIERFQEELVSIQRLEERLGAEKRKVQAYRERLERVQERIDKQKEMENVWRQRASRRLRFLWGFISVLVILWLLATASNDRPSESTDLQVKVGHSFSPPIIQHMGDSREL